METFGIGVVFALLDGAAEPDALIDVEGHGPLAGIWDGRCGSLKDRDGVGKHDRFDLGFPGRRGADGQWGVRVPAGEGGGAETEDVMHSTILRFLLWRERGLRAG